MRLLRYAAGRAGHGSPNPPTNPSSGDYMPGDYVATDYTPTDYSP